MRRWRLTHPGMLVRAAAALMLITGLWANTTAQEVASIDLTQITPHTDLRRPGRTSATSGPVSSTNENHACTDIGQRVGAQSELEGLDLPEMGALGYPEFQLVPSGLGRSVEVVAD